MRLQFAVTYSNLPLLLDSAKFCQAMEFCQICYGPSVISVTATKGGHPRGGGLYKASKTMGQGVAESRSQLSTWKRGNVETCDVLIY